MFYRCAFMLPIVLSPTTPGVMPASGQTIAVLDDRLVSDSSLTWPIVEPHLAVDPGNSDHLVATAMVVRSVDWNVEFSTTCFTFVTFDRGESWLQHDFDLEECGDPWIAVTHDGLAILTVLGRPRGEEDGLWVYRSEDGGRTWPDDPKYIGRSFDHQTMVVDTTGGRWRGSAYLVSAESVPRPDEGSDSGIHISRTADGGNSFAIHEHIVPSNLALEAQNPVVFSDGGLAVPFQDHQARPRRRLERRRSWLVVSQDGGLTYSAPRFITESCARTRPAAWPSLAVDHSERFTDRLYWICEEQHFEGVLVHHSSDRGDSWSEPLRIGHGGVRNPHTKTPTMSVSPGGILGIVWYDGREHPWHACHRLYFAYSDDGAESFSTPEPVSAELSCPFTPQNGDAAWRFPGGGDYIGMAPLSDGAFFVVWTDSRDGIYRLRAAMVAVTGP